MNAEGIIDAVITNDSDIFLFGLYLTRDVSWNVREDKDSIRLYKKTAMSLNRESLILFGLLMGGDYDNKVFNLYYYGLLLRDWHALCRRASSVAA